jgi:hypothetical protein
VTKEQYCHGHPQPSTDPITTGYQQVCVYQNQFLVVDVMIVDEKSGQVIEFH